MKNAFHFIKLTKKMLSTSSNKHDLGKHQCSAQIGKVEQN